MTSVIIGEFGAVHRAGFMSLLAGENVQVVGQAVNDLSLRDQLASNLPDVVLINLDAPGSSEMAGSLCAEFPALKVVGCAVTRPVLRIYPPNQRGQSYETTLDREQLVRALTSIT